MIFVSDVDALARLKARLAGQVVPYLTSLEFHSPKPFRASFPRLWIRDRGHTIDMLDFQWMTRGRPAFIINFREVTHPDDLKLVCDAPSEATPWDFGLRASMAPRKERWFGSRMVRRLQLTIDAEIQTVVDAAINRLGEISSFLVGGPPSRYLCDAIAWNDKRLPDNPPPWTDKAPASSYHLPYRRAGTNEDPWGK